VSWGFPASRAVASGSLTSSCVHGSPAVSSCARTYSGQRPRSWTRPGGAFGPIARGRGSGSGRYTEPLVPGFRWPAVLGEEPVRFPEDHWWIDRLAHAWPTGSPRDPRAITRTLLISGYRFGLTTPGGSPRLLGPHMGCRMQRSVRINRLPAGRCGVSFRRPPTDLGCTCGGPFIYLVGWYRERRVVKRGLLPAQS
jgi:hypothetical protein